MKKSGFLVVAALLASASLVQADPNRSTGVFSAPNSTTQHSFSLRAPSIRGAATGEVSLIGAGTFNPATGFVAGGGEFRSLQDVHQGPLTGLQSGEGVHWTALELLSSSGFKCGSDPGEPLKTATTSDRTIVMKVGFFRRGDGATPSFTANVFVSADDLDPAAAGTQNVWIQQIGCADAIVDLR